MTKAQQIYRVFRPYMTKDLARYATIRLMEIQGIDNEDRKSYKYKPIKREPSNILKTQAKKSY